MPLVVLSQVGGGLKGGSPCTVFPVIVKTSCPKASHENATREAAMTTRALRTDGRRTTEQMERSKSNRQTNKNIMYRLSRKEHVLTCSNDPH